MNAIRKKHHNRIRLMKIFGVMKNKTIVITGIPGVPNLPNFVKKDNCWIK